MFSVIICTTKLPITSLYSFLIHLFIKYMIAHIRGKKALSTDFVSALIS